MKKILLLGLTFLTTALFSAPFDRYIEIQTSNGITEKVHQFGTEFSMIYETTNGYTLVKDNGLYYYAYCGNSNQLISTKIEIGNLNDAIKKQFSIVPHLRDRSLTYLKNIKEKVEKFENDTFLRERWNKLKKQNANRKLFAAPPAYQTIGSYTGLTILVDFPISNSTKTLWEQSHPTFTEQECDNFLNGNNYTNFGNHSSVREFFYNISNNRLDYRNVVIGPILMDNPREYYDDEQQSDDVCRKILIDELFQKILNSDNEQHNDILAKLRTLSFFTYYGKKYVRAINILYAGPQPNEWAYGLWPHSSGVTWRTFTFPDLNGNGVRLYNYQMTSILDSYNKIQIGVFCHENGHLLCDFPDLYDYEYNSYGVGKYSLMGYGNNSSPPVPVDPYLAEMAGWIDVTYLPYDTYNSSIQLILPYNRQKVYKFENAENPNQYYLIENRQKKNLDANLPGSGILIWRCDKDGDNQYPVKVGIGSSIYDSYAMNYECAIVQADGNYELERKMNYGNQGDFWYRGAHSSSTYENRFTDISIPAAKWINGRQSTLKLYDFSENGDTMTVMFSAGDYIPSFAFTGMPITPNVRITWNSLALIENNDYVLVYSNNVNIGTAQIYIKGTNNFSGQIIKKFKIVQPTSLSNLNSPINVRIK